ncbi:protein kinase [Micromonospora sp. KC723]|uniref:protein kinase domain-containing protein n=1 Tax=Micromonospora sp. KC723 TaxID=2530381 RepID=UPI00268554FE
MLTKGLALSDRYRLSERVATGGMGTVWRCVDTLLDREVAVKVLLPTLIEDPEFTTRFHAEARMLAALRHPGIVAVHDFGSTTLTDGNRISYLVMEYVDGEPLSAWIRRAGRLDPASTMSAVAQAAAALHIAHTAGIVHRDVKPGNLLVKRDGTIVLVDFGIARSRATASITAAHMVLGTASYMSPEQAIAQPVSAATDVYALGAVAYHCLTGQPPFVGDNPLQVALRHAQDTPPPLPRDIPPPVVAVVERALAKNPAERWPTAEAMAEAAMDARDATMAVSPVPPRPPWAVDGPALPAAAVPPLPAGANPATPPAPAGATPATPPAPSKAAVAASHGDGPGTGSGALPAAQATGPAQAATGAGHAVGGPGQVTAGPPGQRSAAGAAVPGTPGSPPVPPYPGGPYPAVVGGQQDTPPFAYAVPGAAPTREERAGGARRRRLALAGTAGAVVAVLAGAGTVMALQADKPASGGPASNAESAVTTLTPAAPATSASPNGRPKPSASSTRSRSATPDPAATPTGPRSPAGTPPETTPTTAGPEPGTTTSAPVVPNPYKPTQICGSGYKVIDSAALTAGGVRQGRVYLLWNGAAKANCVVTLKETDVGERTTVSAYLEVKRKKRNTDRGSFEYYAGPVRAGAGGTCVKWGGTAGGASYGSGFEHCG